MRPENAINENRPELKSKNIFSITNDVLFNIFQYINDKDKLNLSVTSKLCYFLSNNQLSRCHVELER